MHRRAAPLALTATLAALLAAGASTPLAAQDEGGPDEGDVAAYGAISYTPLGALPPVTRADLGGTGTRRVAVHAQLGYAEQTGPFSRRSYGVGVDLPVGRSTLTFSGGFIDFACDEDELNEGGILDVQAECNSGFMGGASWFTPLVRTPIGSSADAAITVGVDAAIGASTFDAYEFTINDPIDPELSGSLALDGSALSAGVGFPFALPLRSGGITLTLHLTPRFAFGRMSVKVTDSELGAEEDAESGTRFMLGGGIGMLFASSGLGVDVGFQRVFIEDGDTLVGIGVSYHRH